MSTEEMCTENCGAEGVKKLVHDWGYEPLMPENEVQWDPVPISTNIMVGIYLFVIGISGTVACLLGIYAHKKLSSQLMDSTGLMLVNFLVANLGVCILLFPFSGISSFQGRWVFGDFGCQAYSALGFIFGMEIILGLGLIIVDLYLLTYSKKFRTLNNIQRGNVYFVFICLSWFASCLCTAPPLMGFMSRFHLEPCGTMCTIDYWHGNFKHYNTYMFLLTIFGFIIPVSFMALFFVRSVKVLERVDVDSRSKSELAHFAGMSKLCGYGFMVQLICWSPFTILCLWTTIFEADTLNLYFTMSAPLVAKFSPVVSALLVIYCVPRVRIAKDFLLNRISESDLAKAEIPTNLKPLVVRMAKNK